MKNYLKYFGIWLGGPILLVIGLAYLGLIGLLPFPLSILKVAFYVFIIVGTIVGVLKTQKAEGNKVSFGKSFGTIAVIILLFLTFSWMMFYASRPTDILSSDSIFYFFGTIVSYWWQDLAFFYDHCYPCYYPMFFDFLPSLLIVLSILLTVGVWYTFQKAGQKGWKSLVPIYNLIILCRIAKKPEWYTLIILLVPIANIVFLIMLYNSLSKQFGKSTEFTVGLVLASPIFISILGYGKAKYIQEPK